VATYYVNHVAQANGDHEVHKTGCSFMPSNAKNLGNHLTCKTAVVEAKKTYWKSNGCFFCSRECHTS